MNKIVKDLKLSDLKTTGSREYIAEDLPKRYDILGFNEQYPTGNESKKEDSMEIVLQEAGSA